MLPIEPFNCQVSISETVIHRLGFGFGDPVTPSKIKTRERDVNTVINFYKYQTTLATEKLSRCSVHLGFPFRSPTVLRESIGGLSSSLQGEVIDVRPAVRLHFPRFLAQSRVGLISVEDSTRLSKGQMVTCSKMASHN